MTNINLNGRSESTGELRQAFPKAVAGHRESLHGEPA
jgi:hypothetical protein